MTITIHIGSLLAGLILGFLLGSFVLPMLFVDERWLHGFDEGWKAGKKYAEKKLLEGEENETD